jgi:hypothetical protein
MKVAVRFFVLLISMVTFPAFSQGYTVATPSGWSLEWRPDQKNKSGAPNATLSSTADNATASVSILQGRDASVLSTEDMQGVLLAMAEESLPNSREGRGTIRTFGQFNTGLYLRLTDKNSDTAFKYMTYAINRKGPHLSLGVLMSNDSGGAILPKLFGVLESIEVGSTTTYPPLNSNPYAPASPLVQRVPSSSVEAEVWGAIASEVNMTDNEPLHAFGSGDTRAEAEKDALAMCREEGAKRCTVRVTYTQCGALAVSGSGKAWGWGTGATKRAAEKSALGSCKGVNCDIVASDCN